MKRLLPLLLVAGSALAADLYLFSSDGATAGSKPRELPSAAIRLDTREPVFGMHALSDAERAACGWYRILPPERPAWATNHTAVVTNYLIRAEGTAESLAKWREIPRRTVKLDRDKVAAAVRAAGYGAMLDNWTAMPIELAQWYFSEMEYVPGGQIAKSIMQQFGWSEEQLEAFVEACRAD